MTERDQLMTMLARAGINFTIKERRVARSDKTRVLTYEVVIDNGGWSGATLTFGPDGGLLDVWIGD